MLNLIVVMFSIVCCWHNQIQSMAIPIKALPQSSNTTNRNNSSIKIPTTLSATSNTGSMNSVNAALLSQVNKSNANSLSKKANLTSDLSTKKPMSASQELLVEKKEFRNSTHPYAQRAEELAQAQQIRLRADDEGILKKERAEIRAEKEFQKELAQQFDEIKDAAFTTIKKESIQIVQWGDNFPITKSLFAYLCWREEAIIVAAREELKAERQAKRIACQEIKSLVAFAIAGLNHDQKKKIQFLINSSIDCDQTPDKKEDDKLNNAFF